MIQHKDTIIVIGKRKGVELSDSALIQELVNAMPKVDSICLLPLKELPVTKAVKIKVNKLDTLEPINFSHPSFENEARQYYAEYKTSISYEKPIETNDMNTLVHDVNAIFIVFVLIWKLKQSVLPRMVAMVRDFKNVWKGEVV